MAIILAITYQKKLGLPNYSSHSCSVSLTVEIADVSAVAEETNKLYRLLQSAVDHEIQEVGFMPDATRYGMNNPGGQIHSNGSNGNGPRANGNTHHRPQNGTGQPSRPANGGNENGAHDVWNCTPGQTGMIKRLVHENNVPKDEVESMAQQLFGVGVKQLDKMQASQLIEDLLERCGKRPQRSRWQNNRQPSRT